MPSTSAAIARKGLSSTARAKLLFYARVAVAALALMFVIRSTDPKAILQSFTAAGRFHVLMAAALLLPNVLLQMVKWLYILRLANPAISVRAAYRSLVVGFPLGFVTPGRLGEIGRALFIQEISQMRALRLVALDKISNLLVTVTMGLIGLLTLDAVVLSRPLALAAATVLCLTAGTILMMFFSKRTRARLAGMVRLNTLELRSAGLVILLSFGFYAVFAAQFMFLIRAFGHLLFLENAQAVASVFLVKTLLPFAFADLGIREGAAVYYFGKLAYPAGAAFNAASLLFLINVVGPALLGLPILLKARKKR